jgi:hypothetical protein
MDSCLGAVRQSSCDAIGDGQFQRACAHVLTGRVAADGFCLDDSNCATPGQVCAGTVGGCGRSCQRNLAAVTPVPEGGPCASSDSCASGSFCKVASAATTKGVCRRIVAGSACVGSWECAWPAVCVGDVAAGGGTCRGGKPVGQPCQDRSSPTDPPGSESDCASFLRCARAPGQQQTTCLVDTPPPRPPIVAPAGPGAVCNVDASLEEACPLDNFCHVVDPNAGRDDLPIKPPPTIGTCAPLRSDGQACEFFDACLPASTCLDNVCTRCPRGPGLSPPFALPVPKSIGTGLAADIAALAVDGDAVYLAEGVPRGRVLRVALAGDAPAQVLAAAQNVPAGIAIDATHVYWGNGGNGTGRGSVSRVPLAGGTIEVVAPDESGVGEIAVDATHVYWSAPQVNALRRWPKAGGAAETFTPGVLSYGLALDTDRVYWTDVSARTVNARPKAGGPAVQLVSGVDSPGRIVVGDSFVAWTAYDQIGWIAKAGGPPSSIETFGAKDLVVAAAGPIWSTSFSIQHRSWTAAPGTPPTLLVNDVGLDRLVISGGSVIFPAKQAILRLPLP